MTVGTSASLVSPSSTSIIAEIAQAHDGDVELAHRYIDAAADCGCHAVKFQTHLAAEESSEREPWRVRFTDRDATRYDYWKRMEFSEPQWAELRTHAREAGLLFVSSPFSAAAVALLERVGVDGWKIASGEISNSTIREALASAAGPILVSTGMSPWKEIDAAVAWVKGLERPFALLQCTSEYPCPPERVGLNVLDELQSRYECAVGLSDHSGTVFPGLAAATLGACVVEVHLTLTRDSGLPDVPASLLPDELRLLVEGAAFLNAARNSPVDKDAAATAMEAMRSTFMQGVVAARELAAGAVLAREDLSTRKPMDGFPAAELPNLIGRRTRRGIARLEPIGPNDLEEAS